MEDNNKNSTSRNEENVVKGQDYHNDEGVLKFTEEQLARKIKCRTKKGELVEVYWHLMMQSKTFMETWENVGDQPFPLNDITKSCFAKIVEWMEEHKGQPEPVVREDPITKQRIWFTFTEWERNFFNVDFETLKDFMVAANYLDLKSLYLNSIQECARLIMPHKGEEKEVLQLE